MEQTTLNTRKANRLHLLKVPIDILPENELEQTIIDLLTDNNSHQIVLITLWDFMRARRDLEYRRCLSDAALVLPVSKGILKGAHFLEKGTLFRYLPYDFIIQLLGILERKGKSLYILGSKRQYLQISENNLRQTFPGLKIVGRYAGYYPKDMEKNLILAIKKSSPTLLLVEKGVPGKEKWIHKHKKEFNPGIALWNEDCFEIFADKKKRIPKETFKKGREFVPALMHNPWRIFRGFVYLYYLVLLLIYKFKKL